MAEKRVFVVYWAATKWPRNIFVTDDAPVIAYFEARAKKVDTVNGCRVIEVPMSEYSRSTHDALMSHLEEQVGTPSPVKRIVGVDVSDQEVKEIVYHPDPERFIASRSDSKMIYEEHDTAKPGATKERDGSFKEPPPEKVDPDSPAGKEAAEATPPEGIATPPEGLG